jgi:hypothetical protein
VSNRPKPAWRRVGEKAGALLPGANGAANRGAGDRGAADRRVLDGIDVPALGFSKVSRDSIGEVEPRFGNAREPGLVGEHGGPFRQIKVCGRQSPALEIRTHFRTYSTAREKRSVADRVRENVKKTCAVPQAANISASLGEKNSLQG